MSTLQGVLARAREYFRRSVATVTVTAPCSIVSTSSTCKVDSPGPASTESTPEAPPQCLLAGGAPHGMRWRASAPAPRPLHASAPGLPASSRLKLFRLDSACLCSAGPTGLGAGTRPRGGPGLPSAACRGLPGTAAGLALGLSAGASPPPPALAGSSSV